MCRVYIDKNVHLGLLEGTTAVYLGICVCVQRIGVVVEVPSGVVGMW